MALKRVFSTIRLLQDMKSKKYFNGCCCGYLQFDVNNGVDIDNYSFYQWEIDLLKELDLVIITKLTGIK